jgi:NADH:ubiquinone oxidoreductase subunit F (NADH-binding)/(2Fe-2S) ferredoxin/NAD-dependent dihydropyrimidine dehydrogenase PreA subunit
MPKLTIEDLKRKREGFAAERHGQAIRAKVNVHMGTCGIAAGARPILAAFNKELEKSAVRDVFLTNSGCAGLCSQEPMATVELAGRPPVLYVNLTEPKVHEIFEKHVLAGTVVEDYVLADIPFFKKQVLIALRNRGLINPEKIDEAIARGGYKAMAKALSEMPAEKIINEIMRAGLRGRGGAGFPTGLKWQFVRNAARSNGGRTYLVCNGDEGDPGAFMDRSILEADPHAVIEGMVIGAKAMGATDGFVYVRNEYPLAVERLGLALEQARAHGLLGRDILGSGFDFDIQIKRGAGAFVCGEETALLASIEGRLGEPKPRPPYPAQRGLWDKPTCINNVETWATVPVIVDRGADWFSGIGTATSKGTKVFSLVGKINNTGLIEVPMGMTLREIIFEIGGGIPGGKAFKAVQTGGPSGGCIPKEKVDLPIDYESLTEAGSMMGSGGMVVMDEDTCMVDIARYFLSFTQDESCGKCTPCREGTKAMLEILTRITAGKGTDDDLVLLERLASAIKDTALCGLGKTAPNPVLTTLRYFREEYETHIRNKKCPARVCRSLNVYTIDPDLCLRQGRGCDVCRRNCASEAITGQKNKAHAIIQAKCIKCGVCFDVCNFGAVRID